MSLGTWRKFRIIYSRGTENRSKIKAFREGLLAEVSKTADTNAQLENFPNDKLMYTIGAVTN